MKKLLTALLIATSALSTASFGAVISFEGPTQSQALSYQYSGYTIANPTAQMIVFNADEPTSYWNGNGTARLLTYDNSGGSSGFTLTKSDGSAFSLSSLEFGNGYTAGNLDLTDLTLTGTLVGGGTITQNFGHPGLGIFNAVLDASWTGLSSVLFTANGSNNRTIFDNIVVDEAADVPEPAMLGLFGLGAIGLGLSRRRKV